MTAQEVASNVNGELRRLRDEDWQVESIGNRVRVACASSDGPWFTLPQGRWGKTLESIRAISITREPDRARPGYSTVAYQERQRIDAAIEAAFDGAEAPRGWDGR